MTIKSDNALYNKLTYSTEFKNNVIINYLDNTISSEMLNFNLKENNILISKNVIYKSNFGIVKADNILIDLTTKNAEIFMNSGEKIQVTSKE